MSRIRHGFSLVCEHILRLVIVPKMRARLLNLLGADIGDNVRIQECRFMNLSKGFSNLHLADDVFIGTDCLIDLQGPVKIGRGTTLASRVTIMSHTDPGSSHESPIVNQYPPEAIGVEVGEHCWIGANATILSGTKIGAGCVIGSMGLVRGALEKNSLYAGVPVRRIRSLDTSWVNRL